MNLKRYQRLKAKIEARRREVDRAIGARDRDFQRLQSEYDCDTILEAERLLATLTEKRKRSQERFDRELAELERKWEGKL